jgi:ubiquinone/menaquinone biosynthesis C-methylase UbiE
MAEPLFTTAAKGYDALFGRVTRLFIPALLQAARVRPGDRVLDVATGTGAAALAAAEKVGPAGQVIGGDISPHMLDVARRNLQGKGIELVLLNGQALPYPDDQFDSVLCQLGLMFFDDAAAGLSEFRRVLRPGGWTAVSVTPSPERSLFGRIGVVIGRHVPETPEPFKRVYSIPGPGPLGDLLRRAGFRDVHVQSETRDVTFATFDDYFRGIEEGAGFVGQEYVRLPRDIGQAVREEVRKTIAPDSEKPLVIGMEVLIGSGRK